MEYVTKELHEEYVKRMEDEHKRINVRLEKCEKNNELMQGMNTNISNLAINMKHLLDEQLAQGKRLDKIEDEPQHNVGLFKKGFIGAIGSAVGTAIIFGIACLIYVTMKG